MKLTELTQLIRTVIAEEIALKESKVTAIDKIKKILSENEISDEEISEIFGFGNKPATDEELNAWLTKSPAISANLKKMDPEKANKWREFVKAKFAKNIKNGEAIMNVKWDDAKKEFTTTSAPSGGGKLGFSENKKK